ncbi:MAG: hypothetical protein IJS60_05155 [Abditibacteriota bacterium]|nr:hypothetical protein [Abditibacteriota bacterium]
MKVCVFQPEYSYNTDDADRLFQSYIETLDSLDKSCDVIVFPEYSNVPVKVANREELLSCFNKYTDSLHSKAIETAKRCKANVFIGWIYGTSSGLRNTIVAYNSKGERVGEYYKQHLVPREMSEYKLDSQYSYESSEPTIIEIDGVKYAFMICYDCYFYELLSNIGRYDPDVLIVSAYQRSDTHDTLAFMNQFAAYNTNAYILRSSVSLGGSSPTGGSSMIVSPEGKILADAYNNVGVITADIDPHKRYLKPAGFGNPPAPHHKYIEAGRRPWKYRPAGPFIIPDNETLPYPRMCAHRGFNTIAPENSMPAFGAAVALGAEEIEFDLWETKDHEIVSIHDPNLDRVSNGTGFVGNKTLKELKELDFGSVYSPEFEGLQIPTFEEILKKFTRLVIMNVHIKHVDDINPLPEEYLKKIIDLCKKYDCEKYVYFMTGNPAILRQLEDLAPHMERCAGATEDPKEDLVEKALKYGCKKIQLFSPHFEFNPPDYVEKAVEKAHKNGIKVNLFYSDDPKEAKMYLDLGVDTILTNDYHRVGSILK